MLLQRGGTTTHVSEVLHQIQNLHLEPRIIFDTKTPVQAAYDQFEPTAFLESHPELSLQFRRLLMYQVRPLLSEMTRVTTLLTPFIESCRSVATQGGEEVKKQYTREKTDDPQRARHRKDEMFDWMSSFVDGTPEAEIVLKLKKVELRLVEHNNKSKSSDDDLFWNTTVQLRQSVVDAHEHISRLYVSRQVEHVQEHQSLRTQISTYHAQFMESWLTWLDLRADILAGYQRLYTVQSARQIVEQDNSSCVIC